MHTTPIYNNLRRKQTSGAKETTFWAEMGGGGGGICFSTKIQYNHAKLTYIDLAADSYQTVEYTGIYFMHWEKNKYICGYEITYISDFLCNLITILPQRNKNNNTRH